MRRTGFSGGQGAEAQAKSRTARSASRLGGPAVRRANGPGDWLPDMDLNHDKQIQSLLCYRYTIGQAGAEEKLETLLLESSCQSRTGPLVVPPSGGSACPFRLKAGRRTAFGCI